jgi:hypothetical protein
VCKGKSLEPLSQCGHHGSSEVTTLITIVIIRVSIYMSLDLLAITLQSRLVDSWALLAVSALRPSGTSTRRRVRVTLMLRGYTNGANFLRRTLNLLSQAVVRASNGLMTMSMVHTTGNLEPRHTVHCSASSYLLL